MAGALSLALIAMGCGRSTRLEPPVIHLGEDVCSRCNMIVSEERFAVAHVLIAESKNLAEPALFDDISCLIEAEQQVPDGSVAARWVHAGDGTGWIEASSAYFVRSPDIRSPMGGGVLAARSADGAQSILEKTPGKLLRFEELRSEMKEGRHGS
jgi:copper chaperone NosL